MKHQREILDAIRRILRALRESSKVAEYKHGVSGAQLLVLQNLNSENPLSINELAEKTQTHQSSVSIVVSKLEKAGLVRRKNTKVDARRVEVRLSPKGRRLLTKDPPDLAQEKLFSSIAQLSHNEQKQLAGLLSKIVNTAGFNNQPATLFFEEDIKLDSDD
ncbi:MAG: MarR family transcriptional regulator [Bdellovibrionales bacterium]|nr:MarR family transcriptional regulator [Bdellovibrionales bacterium]